MDKEQIEKQADLWIARLAQTNRKLSGLDQACLENFFLWLKTEIKK